MRWKRHVISQARGDTFCHDRGQACSVFILTGSKIQVLVLQYICYNLDIYFASNHNYNCFEIANVHHLYIIMYISCIALWAKRQKKIVILGHRTVCLKGLNQCKISKNVHMFEVIVQPPDEHTFQIPLFSKF